MADRKPYRRIVKSDGVAQDEHDVVDLHADALDVSPAGAALLGLGQGITADHGDELYGAVSAVGDQLTEPDADLMADFRRHRDSNRELDSRAQDQQPAAHLAGDVVGDTLTNAGLAIATGGASVTPAGQGLFGAVKGYGANESGGLQAVGDAVESGMLRAATTQALGKIAGRLRGAGRAPAAAAAPESVPLPAEQPPLQAPTRVDGSLAADAARAADAVNPHAEHVLAQADKMKALLAARKAARAAGGTAGTGDEAADAMLGDMARQTLAGKPSSTPLSGPVGADNPAAGQILGEAQRLQPKVAELVARKAAATTAAPVSPVSPKAVQRVADLLDNDPDFAAQFGDELMAAAQEGPSAVTDTIQRLSSTNPGFASALESTRALRPTKP